MNTSLKYLGIALLVLCACEKQMEEPEPSSDYRSEWVGEYKVWAECFSWMLGEPYETTSYWDTVTVAILPGSQDSLLIDGQVKIQMDTSGYFFSSPFPSNWYELTLWDDSISITTHGGGLGGGYGCSKLGAKIP
ncbi:MAG: hypothetical protein HKN79_03395 [Flavobacteriales bacterium]|nr:hypothetical protein [Flavobacteriales bacterium]